MKKLIQTIGITLLLFVGLFAFSCSGGESTEKHGANATFTSAYVCPMHCKDTGSDKAGSCKVCGMDYVKLEDHAKDGHKH